MAVAPVVLACVGLVSCFVQFRNRYERTAHGWIVSPEQRLRTSPTTHRSLLVLLRSDPNRRYDTPELPLGHTILHDAALRVQYLG